MNRQKPSMVTIYELNALERLQQQPNALYELTPKGMEFSRAKYEMQRWRDRRIDYIQNRLQVKEYEMRRNFDRSR